MFIRKKVIKDLEERVSDLEEELDNHVRGQVTPDTIYSYPEPTLNAKIDLLAQHLGVVFEVDPYEEQIVEPEAKLIVKNKTTKKGRK